MDQNYRTTESSIKAINQFGETMSNQLTDGRLEGMSGRVGTIPQVHAFETDYEEATYIIKDIREKLDSGVPPNEIAVIYRGKAASKTLKKMLETEKVQFETVGDVDFYSMKEVKVTMALMRLLINRSDRFALFQIMDEIPVGITKANLGAKASEAKTNPMAFLKSFAINGGVRGNKAKDLLNEIEDMRAYVPFLTDEEMAHSMSITVQQYNHEYSFNTAFRDKANKQIFKFISEVTPMFSDRILTFFDSTISENFQKAAEKLFIKKNKGANDDEVHDHVAKTIEKRRERVTKLCEILSKTIQDGATYQEAVDELLLLADNTKNNKVGSIFLMTGHASKGLEFDHTYFLGAEQGSFFRDENPDESTIHEEERLFYVGTTRHKKSIQITRCNSRFVNGETKYFQPLEMLTRLAGSVENFDWTIDGKAQSEKELTESNAEVSEPTVQKAYRKPFETKKYVNKEVEANSIESGNGNNKLKDFLKKGSNNTPESSINVVPTEASKPLSSSDLFKSKIQSKKAHQTESQVLTIAEVLDKDTDVDEYNGLLFSL
jgi:DNA helicase-2/ATP-dependent DNA helicase PcrA